MQKFKDFFDKNGIILFSVLLFLFFIQTCSKNRKINRVEKKLAISEAKVDSLVILVPTESNIEIIKNKSKLEVYDKLNTEMSKLRRNEQLMDFQNEFIIPAKEKLESEINSIQY